MHGSRARVRLMQSVTQNAEIPLHNGKLKAIAPFAASALLLGLAPAAQAEESHPGFELVSTSTVTLEEAMQQDRITTFAANDAIETYVTEQAAEGREVDPENVTAIEFDLLDLVKTGRVRIHLVPEGTILLGVTSPMLVFRLRTGETVISSDHVDGNVIYDADRNGRLTTLITGAMAEALPARLSLEALKDLA
ncbi:Scr1 family TA system antitoxin-like transcriptional regulator [Nocardiopsis sp. RV163]|uniref:Scr1 family TA system antitoxin-like transcriptional regulator n=1 Tax=Nocardiopsis sp. RV163 TaxID=1661388 RepID=UPI001F19E84C|nr:Scr1 family TA system antitoxin-like transcriptional regulator [Nocardiopsis sp. RV163]